MHRDIQQFVDTDGRTFWVDVSVSCLPEANGEPEYLQQKLAAELNAAARYTTNIMPADLSGPGILALPAVTACRR